MSLAKTILPCLWASRSSMVPYSVLMVMEAFCKYWNKFLFWLICRLLYIIYCRLGNNHWKTGQQTNENETKFQCHTCDKPCIYVDLEKKLYETDEKVTHILMAENKHLHKNKHTHQRAWRSNVYVMYSMSKTTPFFCLKIPVSFLKADSLRKRHRARILYQEKHTFLVPTLHIWSPYLKGKEQRSFLSKCMKYLSSDV